jgi:hypothetical protein
MVIYRDVIL